MIPIPSTVNKLLSFDERSIGICFDSKPRDLGWLFAPCLPIAERGVNCIARSDEEIIDVTMQNTPATIEEYDNTTPCPHKN